MSFLFCFTSCCQREPILIALCFARAGLDRTADHVLVLHSVGIHQARDHAVIRQAGRAREHSRGRVPHRPSAHYHQQRGKCARIHASMHIYAYVIWLHIAHDHAVVRVNNASMLRVRVLYLVSSSSFFHCFHCLLIFCYFLGNRLLRWLLPREANHQLVPAGAHASTLSLTFLFFFASSCSVSLSLFISTFLY